MSHWYRKITNDLSAVADAFDYFEAEYEAARKELPFSGKVEHLAQRISGVAQYRISQMYEIEGIMRYLELMRNKKFVERTKHYTEHYQRQLSENAARRYAEGDPDVVALDELRLQMGIVRDKFISITKGLDIMQYQITNVTKLRVAGVEDAVV